MIYIKQYFERAIVSKEINLYEESISLIVIKMIKPLLSINEITPRYNFIWNKI